MSRRSAPGRDANVPPGRRRPARGLAALSVVGAARRAFPLWARWPGRCPHPPPSGRPHRTPPAPLFGRTTLRGNLALAAASAALGVLLSGCTALAEGAQDVIDQQQPQSRQRMEHTLRTGHPDLWVNPETPAARQMRQWQLEGRTADAGLLRRIAEQPVAEWIGDHPETRVDAIVDAAERAGRTPVLAAYHIPYRDCGNHSAGGAGDAAAYRQWIRAVAAGIGSRRAIVVLEPDAVAQAVDGCVPQQLRSQRFALLNDAVATLSALPAARVYLDAGHPDWIKDTARLVEPLRLSGVDAADGFALNVSNFQPTRTTEEYGRRLSRALGGKPFVIDTSRNGNGPVQGVPASDERAWCNPPGRALGELPTLRTGRSGVDAFLWVKRPGESDGTCNGGPPAGDWWPRYALDLARTAGG
ncbi:glycoside hydrolase family 6 protein [Streptomyces sp. NPDC002055]|uniref:glycoside hydrolase family 6 protein n=1 Tax=Streptomyces sp. NPDC002055 TaxID=3154534 RepID=UPI00331C3791